jgi:tetratricopeptide (TPR) repeat protein
MELVGGGSLEQRIRQHGTLPEAEVLHIGHEVAEGLRAAQRVGLVHRDVKPANILFTETGTAKVVDFGLAIFIEHDVDESGELWATPFYVAPEKVIENREDHRSDIFSLGATMYHALTGKPPHKANTNSISELRIIKCRRVSLEESGLHFGARTQHVVNRMTAFKPEDRFANYDELIDELRFAEGLVGRSLLRRGSRRMRVTLGAAAAIIAAFAVGWVLRDSREKSKNSITAAPSVIENELTGDGVTLQAGAQTTADRFIHAREVLLQGKFAEARGLFDDILRSGARQPTLNWARFNSALCAIVTGNKNDAIELFKMIAAESSVPSLSGGVDLSAFFARLGSVMSANLGHEADPAKLAYAETNEEIMGWLALGLAEWHFGNPREGAESIAKFLAGKPLEKNLEWVPRYRVLVEPYIHDIQIVRGLQKGKPRTMEEAQSALSELKRAREDLKTSGNIVATLRTIEAGITKQIAKFQLEAQRVEMAAAAGRRKRELEQLGELTSTLPSLVQGYDFTGAMHVLNDIKFDSPEVQAALEGKRYLYAKAQDFVKQLLFDINTKGFKGKINRREAGSLEGLMTGADMKQLRLTIDRGVIAVPLDTVDPESLIDMAQAFCALVTDSTEYYRRQELMAAFARIQGSHDAATIAAQLMEENREFRNRWMQVLQGGI